MHELIEEFHATQRMQKGHSEYHLSKGPFMPDKKGRIFVVDNQHPEASDDNRGALKSPLLTISHAALLAQEGDTVIVKAGVYRECVAPQSGGEKNNPVTYCAAPGEKVFVRGSDRVTKWTPVKNSSRVIETLLKASMFTSVNPFATVAHALAPRGKRTCGQVFVEGVQMTEFVDAASVAACPGSWASLDGGKRIILHLPTQFESHRDCEIEITTRTKIFAPTTRGLGYITIRGFTFEHCANQSAGGFWDTKGTQAGAVSARSGHHWIFENNVIRHAKTIGMDIGAEGGADQDGVTMPHDKVGYHLIINNTISDNGECGLTGLGHTGSKIIGNTIERNNCLGYGAVEEAGIKFHFFFDGLIEGNLIRGNDCTGIWVDNVWYGSRITRNIVVDNSGAGIFVEMGSGPILVDNNVIAQTRAGEGLYTHDASGVIAAHNLFYANSHFGVYMRVVTERTTMRADGAQEQVATKNQRIFNNVFIDNYRGHICLPLWNDRVADNQSDYNLFINGTQWQWEGLGFNRFVINTNDKRIDANDIVAMIRKAFAANGIGKDQWPNFERFKEDGFLTLGEWRAAMGLDTHSHSPEVHRGEVENGAIQKGSCDFSASGLFMEYRNLVTYTTLKCPGVDKVDKDLFGNQIPREDALPGPFQKLGKDKVCLRLWPLPQKK